MLQKSTLLLLFFLVSVWGSDLNSVLPKIETQLIKKDQIFDGRWPRYTENGEWIFRKNVNWFSGFISGELWQMYHMDRKPELKKKALSWADALIPYANIDYTHDMGFIFYPSCVEAYKVTGDLKYRNAGLQAADMLAKRFNDKGQFIRAWGKLGTPDREGWIIIDTMMNIELLFWAAQESGDHHYYDIAYRHALTCLRESIREDASSYHVVEFDPESGKVINKRTHQGYTDESTWARGQAWGVYGFANTYRHTGYEPFLTTSKRMAEYMIGRLPADFIPYWDMDLKGKDVLRDASAGVILASGLYLLADQVELKNERQRYLEIADRIMESVIKNYTFVSSKRLPEEGLLIHAIYHFHKKYGVDESYPAGDYYFMEALRKYRDRQQEKFLLSSDSVHSNILFNDHWYYLEDPAENFDSRSKSEKEWGCVELPHTWNRWDVTDSEPGYRRSASWYEKELFVPEDLNQKRILIYFEGANISTEVFVNKIKAGQHIGGYVGFEFEITDLLKKAEWNNISVRVDNSYNPDIIPSQKSDFFIYGGITRDVWLKVLPQTYISESRILTPQVSAKKAVVTTDLSLSGLTGKSNLKLEAEIYDSKGNRITKTELSLKNLKNTVYVKFPEIKNPELWSPDNPRLYTMKLMLLNNGIILDQTEEKFGLRWFEFKEHGSFYLNGERLLLRGTHRHEEHAGYGAAMPNELHRKDIEMIKSVGANFVRLAHYPQDPEVYKTCDEIGLLIWDELPWCRGGMGGITWKENTERLLNEQIKQNFNHPSIIMWSLGNELYWLPDFEGGGNPDSLRAFLTHLNEIAHNLDPGRVTTVRKFYEGADIVDVFSPSIWAGWYSGVYKNYEKALADSKQKYDRFFHAEYGGSSHTGRHDENPISGEGIINPEGWEEDVNQVEVKNVAQYGDWSENYIVDLFDWHLSVSENLDWFTGNAQWAFKDFGTPLRPENAIPYMNQKGLVDREGNPKDAYYVFKSYWTTDPKFCYIESHTWKDRAGPADVKRNVCVYSNCEKVELELNGTTLDKKSKNKDLFPACGLNWDIQFDDGENILIARGLDKDKMITSDTVRINYDYKKAGKPQEIQLTQTALKNGNIRITAMAIDSNGKRCLDYNSRIYFSSDGYGHLLINYGTPGKSDIIEMANGKAEIEFVQVPGKKAVIEARNQDFKGCYLIINN